MAISGRRAVFFSASALLIVGIILATVGQGATQRGQEPQLIRISDMSRDITILESNTLPTLLQAQSYNALSLIAQNANSPGGGYSSISQIQSDFQQCVIQNMCPTSSGSYPLQSTFAGLTNSLQTLYNTSQQYSAATFTLQNVQLSQNDPFSVYVLGTFAIALQDASGAAGYTTTKTIGVSVPIDGLLDPYASNLAGSPRYVRFSRRGVFGDPAAQPTSWTVLTAPRADYVVKAAQQGFYQYDQQGYSYLERLTTSPSTPSAVAGLHSLIPVQSATKVSVDYEMNNYGPTDCLFYILIPGSSTSKVQFTQRQLVSYNLIDTVYQTRGIVKKNSNCGP